ncbi:unnamed protein product [Allacma fusca]|uniref:Uncharacterized protein n=1 Tax=Allacma fusca TaxID=39272 RepID=A0A8J2PVT6_9HEXA|nr:unnamed protein product [Allacma fusca]
MHVDCVVMGKSVEFGQNFRRKEKPGIYYAQCWFMSSGRDTISNLHDDDVPQELLTIDMSRPPTEELLDILQYRKNKYVNDSISGSDYKNEFHPGGERAQLNTSFFNCTLSDMVRVRRNTTSFARCIEKTYRLSIGSQFQ